MQQTVLSISLVKCLNWTCLLCLTVGLPGWDLAYSFLAHKVSGCRVAAVINAMFSVTFSVFVLPSCKTKSNHCVVLNSM